MDARGNDIFFFSKITNIEINFRFIGEIYMHGIMNREF
jgi:hypothetical protein